jgi:hypothetical protein
VECSTSKKTCETFTCGLKPVSRYNTLLNAKCPLNRTLRKLKVNVTSWHREKTARNYRQIAKVENIDYCSMIKSINMIPWFNFFIMFAEESLPGLVQECPVRGVNFTLLDLYSIQVSCLSRQSKSPMDHWFELQKRTKN